MTRRPAPAGDELEGRPRPFPIWGREQIDQASIEQMETAMRLPVTIAGALMPDAHVGYGLPIGGVLATDRAVLPYAVGVDIACRMKLSLYDVPPDELDREKDLFIGALLTQTAFGVGAEWKGSRRADHPVLEDPNWQTTPLLRDLHSNAVRQLGTSGTGNHFVEWGSFELRESLSGLRAGRYLALLSHSGSRSVGFRIAEAYSRLAMSLHPRLDPSARRLAWLSLDSDPGREYWSAMELAGRFASANHQVIHERVAQAAGLHACAAFENHHNFAWRERLGDGTEVIVHRKGATPAAAGILGVIPGSMADPGFLVRGRGSGPALDSASHGAGRRMSRKAALKSIPAASRQARLMQAGVTLLGGGLDESPQAYKPIEEILAAQADLVEVVGEFRPRIVRMADEAGET